MTLGNRISAVIILFISLIPFLYVLAKILIVLDYFKILMYLAPKHFPNVDNDLNAIYKFQMLLQDAFM